MSKAQFTLFVIVAIVVFIPLLVWRSMIDFEWLSNHFSPMGLKWYLCTVIPVAVNRAEH